MVEHRTRKRFGQHFLHDQQIIDRLIRTLGLRPKDALVEIGPGRGALTYPLLAVREHLDVVELDRDLIALLRQEVPADRLTVHESDALKFDFRQLKPADRKLRVVGNLPYNISTPLIFHLLSQADAVSDMTFMLQKEVVDRLTASPGSKDWGRLAIMTQYHCHADALFNVPPGAFSPPPKVDSAVVRLTPHEHMPCVADDVVQLRKLVTQVFTQRRKAIRNGLKQWLDAEAIEALGIDPGCRPEQLSVRDFVTLANAHNRKETRND